MKLTNEQLKAIYFGAYRFQETEDGYLETYQYTEAQTKYFEEVSEFWYDRCKAGSAKTLEFTTTATNFSFDYKIAWMGSPDSIELAVDGVITDIRYVLKIDKEGRMSFDLPEGEKSVILYTPADATFWIKNFEINGEYTPAVKGEKVLWLGDSITQGFGPLRSGQTYVSVANRLLNYDIVNQGIGGYVYDPKVLMKMEGYTPDKIIVALGTNQFGTETMDDIEEYYEKLMCIYGKTPVLCILPLWRGDVEGGEPTLISFCGKLKKIAEKYENVTIVDGFKLVPHLEEYFLDKLHPNCLGCEWYGRNLVEEIRKVGF